MRQSTTLFPAGDWLLAPEGGIVHAGERVAVIADVHLGYEWARGKAGDSVPAHSLGETIARLARLFGRLPGEIARLVVAGDLVESRRPCRRTAEDLRRLRQWLDARGVAPILLAGNHDPRGLLDLVGDGSVAEFCEVGVWTIGHGHRPIPGARTVSGHLHPVFRAGGLTAPCFLVGESRIILPAFSPNAAGIEASSLSRALGADAPSLRCLVSTGEDLLDFGPLGEYLGRGKSPAPSVRGPRRG